MSGPGKYCVGIGCEAAEALVTVRDPGLAVPHELVSRVFELLLKRRLASGPGGSYELRMPVPAPISELARRQAMPPPSYRPDKGARIVITDEQPGAAERIEQLLRSLGYDARLERR